MSESIKAVLLFIMAVAAFAGFFAWVAENPGPLVWTLRTGGPITAIAAIRCDCRNPHVVATG